MMLSSQICDVEQKKEFQQYSFGEALTPDDHNSAVDLIIAAFSAI